MKLHLDKIKAKQFAVLPEVVVQFPELTGRVVPLDAFRAKNPLGCSECAWGQAMLDILCNECVNNQPFREKFMAVMKVNELTFIKAGQRYRYTV